jgi:hypothetical protein
MNTRTGSWNGKNRHCILGSNLPLQVNPSSMRYRTERWLLTSSSRQKKGPALKLRLVPAGANRASRDGLPERDQAARVEFNEK